MDRSHIMYSRHIFDCHGSTHGSHTPLRHQSTDACPHTSPCPYYEAVASAPLPLSRHTMLDTTSAFCLVFNFASSVLIIFVNKSLFSGGLRFEFTCALTAMHYVVNLLGLELLHCFGAYEKRTSPLTPRMVILAMVVGFAPAINNASLKFNSLGFYQVVKLLVTPMIVGMEYACYGHTLSPPRALALLLVCIGVAVAVVNDVSFNAEGALCALCWLPVAAAYKVLWSRVSKEEGWHTLALMRRVLPLATCFMALLVPFIDPPGLLSFPFDGRVCAVLALSGAAAFFVNWSGFLVLGACSALTHTVLGQLKSVVVILGGWLLFSQAYPPKAVGGAAVALCAMVWYTHANIAEQQQARGAKAGSATPDALGASPPIEQQVLLSERPVAAMERTALR